VGNLAVVPREGSIDSLSPKSSPPAGLRLCRTAPAGSIPAGTFCDMPDASVHDLVVESDAVNSGIALVLDESQYVWGQLIRP
jgi:hypothetical protein